MWGMGMLTSIIFSLDHCDPHSDQENHPWKENQELVSCTKIGQDTAEPPECTGQEKEQKDMHLLLQLLEAFGGIPFRGMKGVPLELAMDTGSP